MNIAQQKTSRLEFTIQPLADDQVTQYKALRLQALQLHPDAFLEKPEAFDMKSIETITSLMQTARENGGVTLIAKNTNGEFVGTASLAIGSPEKLAHRGLVWGVYVTPESRGNGLARKLMEAIIEIAKKNPAIKNLRLAVVCSNKGAVDLYTSLGFSVYGTDRDALNVNGSYLDEYLMSKKLK